MKEPILQPIEFLDIMLKWFAMDSNQFTGGNARVRVYQKVIWDGMWEIYPDFKKGEQNRIFVEYFDLSLKKLVKDEYVKEEDYTKEGTSEIDKVYSITFNGKYFWQTKGGYQKTEVASLRTLQKTEIYRVDAEATALRLNLLTAILAVGTLALATSEGIKIYTEKPLFFCRYIALLCIMTMSILSILLYTKKAIENNP